MISSLKVLIILSFLNVLLLGQDSLALASISEEVVKSTYENNQYSEVEKLIKSELELFPQQAPDRLAFLLRYLALAQASIGREDEARSTFASLRLIKPDYQFETGEISPKIKLLFDGIVLDSTRQQISGPLIPAYLIQRDRRSEYILKSIIYPGWGQIKKGEKRGYIWGTLFTVAVVGSGISSYMTYQAEVDYLSTSDQDKIESKYDNFNQWYKLRNGFFVITFATYTINVADISLSNK